MKLLVVLMKEIIESLWRNMKLLYWLPRRLAHRKVLMALKRDGLYVQERFYSDDKCQRLRARIDSAIDNGGTNVWCDDDGADHRVYFINEIDKEMEEFYCDEYIRDVLRQYVGVQEPVGMVLGARIEFKEGNKGSGGGWHRDSPVSHQFKAICYLNEVGLENGPFQYITGSHKKFDVISCYFRGIFKAAQYRFSENEISRYLKLKGKAPTAVTGSEGTLVLVDTKGIHCGAPLKCGVRYAIFCYFWDREIPEHFQALRQRRALCSTDF